MAVARGAQRLAFAVRALCKIIGNNPDVVNPDANPLRRAVYDSVTLACDLFDEFVPARVPSGGLAYTALNDTYTDGVVQKTNFDRSAGKYIMQVESSGEAPVLFSIRVAKNGFDEFTDQSAGTFATLVLDSYAYLGQALVNMFQFGSTITLVAAKRNVQGHLIDSGMDLSGAAVYTSVQPGGLESPYVITTITYKDQNGAQDRIQLPRTYLTLGKARVAGDLTSAVALIKLVAKLADVSSNIGTRAGGAEFGSVMAVSTISNEKLYRRFYA